MKLKSLLTVVFLVLALPVIAQEPVDVQEYGNCVAGTLLDAITDEVGALVFCGGEPTFIVIGRDPGDSSFYIGLHTQMTKTIVDSLTLTEIIEVGNIVVKFRVDKGAVRPGSGLLSKIGFLYLKSDSLAKALTQDMANGQRLHFSIGPMPTETIDLNGARGAIKDMRRRLEAE